MLTYAQLRAIAPRAPKSTLQGILDSIPYLRKAGIAEPVVMAHFLSQTSHETLGYLYLSEIWGPTPAQTRYDTRTDLGNTPERDGDGYRYRGRSLIHLTGKYNYKRFTAWVRTLFHDAPDFVANPDLASEFPWAALAAAWYWHTHKLSALARKGDILAVSIGINGKNRNGLPNGLADRMKRFGQVAMVLLGFPDAKASSVREFQAQNGLLVDGIIGPNTRTKLQAKLLAASTVDDKTDAAVADHRMSKTAKDWTPTRTDTVLNIADLIISTLISAVLKLFGVRK